MLTETQRKEISHLEDSFDEGTQYVLVFENKSGKRYYRIDSVSTLSYVCWRIFKEVQSDGWYLNIDYKTLGGLDIYFFLLNRSQSGYEYEQMSLEQFEEI